MRFHPICHFLKVLEKFDYVVLGDGSRYKLSDNVLYSEIEGEWHPATLSFNDFLSIFSEFSGNDLHEMLVNAHGDEAANKWRKRIMGMR